MQRHTVTGGVTHHDAAVHIKTQAVLACVQKLWADEARTAQVLAAAVVAEYQLQHGADPAQVLDVLSRALRGEFTTDPKETA